MTTNNNRPAIRTALPSELVLMEQLANDLALGGVDAFLANEEQWRRTPLASFMQEPSAEPQSPAIDAVTIYAKWNRRPALATPNVDRAEVEPLTINDLDPAAIYAKWNGAAPQREAVEEV